MLTLANSKHKQERVKMHKMCETAIAVLMRHLNIKLVAPLKCLKNAVFDVRMFLQINWPLLSCCCDQQRKHKKLWTMVFTGPFGKHKMNNILKNIVKIANIPENETKRMKRKHLFQKFKDKIVPDENAIHITGHKHSSSMNKYRTLNENRKE